jgi:sterol desaturase/sphingolipid hydroxylase (fatty acid hydroxylase superfamily)
MASARRIFPLLLLGGLAALCWLERRRPLRQRVAPAVPRWMRNMMVGAGAALVVSMIETPVVQPLSRMVERRRLGLAPRLGLPLAAEGVASLLLLDYTLYLWHVLLHRVPTLWRWHAVHHADPDLDVSTALRFHAVEMLWSLPWRCAQVLLIGVPLKTLAWWARLTAAEVMFHHANLRLPERLERALGCWIVTPRQHGIHHANIAACQRTNLSSGLALWDRLHGTACREVPQDSITIGLPPPRCRQATAQRTTSV